MLRFRASKSAAAGLAYFAESDAGLDPNDSRSEVGGKAASMLGLTGRPDFEQFSNLLHGLDPHTGKQLTAKIVPDRISYWDITASIPKGVTVAIEAGDSRVHDALWEAGREAMADIEALTTTRKRKGGEHADRVSGNLMYYAFEHHETRPNRQDGMPDPDRHIHFVVPNLTFDDVEKEWKAIKFRPIMDLRKYFDRVFDASLARKLTDLGYHIDTKYKEGKYHTWDVKGIPESVTRKFSRRGAEVDALADELGVRTPAGKDRLGATSRLHKRDDLTLEDYRKYWASRITPAESHKIDDAIRAANLGENPPLSNTADRGVRFAIEHEFERKSVIGYHDLAITAMERCMGGAKPSEILPEMRKQGVLFKGQEVTTKEVLAEEVRVIDFAREGKGTCVPMGNDKGRPDESKRPLSQHPTTQLPTPEPEHATLSPEQQALVSHVLTSTDRVILVRGAAGTGKTHAIRAAMDAIDRPKAILAPTVTAAREVLRESFPDANTLQAFLLDEQWQERTRGGVILVDEAATAAVKDVSRLFEVAKEKDARVILMGDPRQHKSVLRNGNLYHILQDYAGLPVAELKDIRRQSGRYKDAVAAIDAGDVLKGHDIFTELKWVRRVPDHGALVDDYLHALATKKPGQSDRDRAIIMAPTHAEGDAITAELRGRLKAAGKLGGDTTVTRLVNLHWSPPQRDDRAMYDGSEVLVFNQNSGTFKRGQVVAATEFRPTDFWKSPDHFAVYRKEGLAVAAGDQIRATANIKDASGRQVDNGTVMTVLGVTGKGIEVATARTKRTLPIDVGHIRHGYAVTSIGGQGKTTDRVFAAMGGASIPALRTEQYYVDLSRARHQATIYTDLPADALREAIQKKDPRKSATELMQPKPRPKRKGRLRSLMKKARERFCQIRDRAAEMTREITQQKEHAYANER